MWCFYPSPVSSISIMSIQARLGGAEEMRVRRKTVNHFSQLLGKQLTHQLTHLCSNQSDLQTTLTTPRSNDGENHLLVQEPVFLAFKETKGKIACKP